MARSIQRAPKGSGVLLQFLNENDISYREAGDALGVSGTTVWQWAHGKKTPTERRCDDIDTWTEGKVPFGSWGVERSVVKPFRPAATGTDDSSS